MDIIGRGFLARNLAPLAHRHPHAVLLAAGVSRVSDENPEDFAREARLVRDIARRCRLTGRTMVFLSTASAGLYGAPGCSGSEDCPHPAGPYGRHKFAMEQLVRSSGCDWLILRLSHVVGPGQAPHQLIPALTRQVESGTVRLFRDTRRDLLDVRHFVRIVDDLLALRVSSEMINLASGAAVPVAYIVTHIAALLGRAPRREYVDRSSDHQVSVRKLRCLLSGGSSGEVFADGYDYAAVLDRYVPHYASTPGARLR